LIPVGECSALSFQQFLLRSQRPLSGFSDLSQGSYCLSDSHEAIISKDDFAQVQKEIDRRAKKKRQFESAASSLVRTINWAEPISSSSSQDLERVRTIDWPDPEELENEK
jgi:hypothetical protein